MAMVNQTNINAIIQKALSKGVSMDKIQGAATSTNQKTGSNIQVPAQTSQPLNSPTSMPVNAPTSIPIPKGPQSINMTTGAVNYGDLGGASKVTGQIAPKNFTQPVQAPSQFAFGQGATNLEQQQGGYISQRNDYLAQEFLKQGTTDTNSILSNLTQNYGDFGTANEQDRQNTAQAIANRIGEMQAQQTPTDTGTPTAPTEQQTYIDNLDTITQNEVDRGIQDYLQEVQRAGQLNLDRPVEDIERNKMLQQRALDRALEQTQFSINNQIADVAQQADQTVAMSDKIGALKGFGRSSGYVQGIQNIKQEADKTIGRLQQQLAFAEQYTGEDKAQIMADFNKDMARVKEDFNFQMREIMDLGKIDLNTLTEKYGLSDDKLGNKIDSITFDVLQKRENLLNSYIENTRSTIAITNDQINVLQNYDNWVGQQRERYTNIINMDGGAALSAMTYSQIDQAVKEGSLAPEQAQAYKQLMVGKSINTLASMGNPTQQDITNLMTAVQGGMSPAAALMQIVSSNPSRYTTPLPAGQQNVNNIPGFGPVDVNNPDNYKMRTDRHNNPVAMTTDVAKTLGLVEGVDYVKGDAFPNNPNLFTARLLGDGIATTIKGLDQAANATNKKAFYTQGGQQRRTYIGMTDDQWLSMTPEQKKNTVLGMYKNEGGSGVLAQGASGSGNEKDAYLELIRRGGMTNSDKKDIADLAAKQGWSDEFNNALKEGASVDLTPTQQIQYNKEYDRFLGNAVVKGFEEGLTQYQSLSYALGDQSGPGDMAGVFAFMKTLDPSSVVRETEFEGAANSAGLANKRSNIYDKLTEGKVLTASQAEDFKRIATKFIEARGQSYNRLYNNLENAYDQFGISKDLLPINAVDQLNSFLSGGGGGEGFDGYQGR